MYSRAPITPAERLRCLQIFHNFQNPPLSSPALRRSAAPDFLDIRPRPAPRPPSPTAAGLPAHGPPEALPHAELPPHAPTPAESPAAQKRVHETSVHNHVPAPLPAHDDAPTPVPTHVASRPLKKPPLQIEALLHDDIGHEKAKPPRRKSKAKEGGAEAARERLKRGKVQFEEEEVALDGHTYLTSRKVSESDVNRLQCAFPVVAREQLKKHFNKEMINQHIYEYLDKDDNCYEATYKEWKSAEALQAQSFKDFYKRNDIKGNDILHIYVINDELPHTDKSGKEESVRFRLLKYVRPLEEESY